MQEESGLFQITITAEGKKSIRKFAAITPLLMILVLIENVVSIYWNIRAIIRANKPHAYISYLDTTYYRTIPYILALIAILTIISTIYYLSFPRMLLRSIETNDEPGANKSFGILFTGAIIFLLGLIVSTASVIWSFLAR